MKRYMGVYHKDTDRLYICCESTSLELCEYYVAKCSPDPDDLPTTLCSSDFHTDWQYIAITEGEPIVENDLPKGIAEYLTEGEPIEENDLPKDIAQYFYELNHIFDWDWIYHKATDRLYICHIYHEKINFCVVKLNPDDRPTRTNLLLTRTNLLLLGLTKGEPIKRNDLPIIVYQYFRELEQDIHYKGIYYKPTDRVYICRISTSLKLCEYYVAKCNPDDLPTGLCGSPVDADWKYIVINEGKAIEENDLPKGIAQFLRESVQPIVYEWIYHKPTGHLYIGRFEFDRGYPQNLTLHVVKCNRDDLPTKEPYYRLLAITEGEPVKRNDLPIIVYQYFRDLLADYYRED